MSALWLFRVYKHVFFPDPNGSRPCLVCLYAVLRDTAFHAVSNRSVTTDVRSSNLSQSVRDFWCTKCQWETFTEYPESSLSVPLLHCSILIHTVIYSSMNGSHIIVASGWLLSNMLLHPSACRQPINLESTVNSFLKCWLLPGVTSWQY